MTIAASADFLYRQNFYSNFAYDKFFSKLISSQFLPLHFVAIKLSDKVQIDFLESGSIAFKNKIHYNKTNLLAQVCNTQRVMPKYRWFEKSLFELMV